MSSRPGTDSIQRQGPGCNHSCTHSAHIYTHAYMHTYTHTAHTYCSHIHAYCSHIHTHTHAYCSHIHTYCSHIHTYRCILLTHTRILFTYTHAYMHTHIYTYTHILLTHTAHTYTCIHTYCSHTCNRNWTKFNFYLAVILRQKSSYLFLTSYPSSTNQKHVPNNFLVTVPLWPIQYSMFFTHSLLLTSFIQHPNPVFKTSQSSQASIKNCTVSL